MYLVQPNTGMYRSTTCISYQSGWEGRDMITSHSYLTCQSPDLKQLEILWFGRMYCVQTELRFVVHTNTWTWFTDLFTKVSLWDHCVMIGEANECFIRNDDNVQTPLLYTLPFLYFYFFYFFFGHFILGVKNWLSCTHNFEPVCQKVWGTALNF